MVRLISFFILPSLLLALTPERQAIVSKISALILEKKYDDSGELFSEHKTWLRQSGSALVQVGTALFKMQRYGQAEGLVERALSLNLSAQERYRGRYLQAEFRILRGQYRSADSLLSGIPNDKVTDKKLRSSILGAHGFILLHMFQPEKAERLVRQSLELNPLNKQARADLELIADLKQKGLLVYSIEPVKRITRKRGHGYYCFELTLGTEREDMKDYLPYLKLIFKNSKTLKRYGYFTSFGGQNQVCAALPAGDYEAIKMSSARKKATYPGRQRFTIRQHQVYMHFCRKMTFFSNAPPGEFNAESTVRSRSTDADIKKFERFIRKINRARLPLQDSQ